MAMDCRLECTIHNPEDKQIRIDEALDTILVNSQFRLIVNDLICLKAYQVKLQNSAAFNKQIGMIKTIRQPVITIPR